MPRYFLAKIVVEGFRGINNESDPLILKFKTDAVNSIFAANGIGKSSLFEALHYAIFDSVPKLDSMHGSEQSGEYYANRFHSAGNSSIEITFSSDDGSPDVEIKIERSGLGIRTVTSPSGHSNPDAFLMQLRSDLRLLDNRSFLRFIEDTPLLRGRSFSSLIGLSQISNFRQALQTLSLSRNINTDFELGVLKQQETDLKTQLEGFVTSTNTLHERITTKSIGLPMDIPTVVAAITAELSKIPLLNSFFATADIQSVDFAAIQTEINKAEKNTMRVRLSEVTNQILSLESLRATTDETKDQAALKALIKERNIAMAQTSGPLLGQLFTATIEVLDSDEWQDEDQCPVCDSELEEPLKTTVGDKLSKYEKVDDAKKKITTNLTNSLWIKRLQKNAIDPLFGIPLKISLPKFVNTISDADFEKSVSSLSDLDKQREILIGKLQKEKKDIEDALPPSLVELTQKVEFSRRVKGIIINYVAMQTTLAAVTKKIELIERWKRFIVRADSDFSNAELSLSTSVTTSLETAYKDIYANITNNPEIVPVLKREADSEELNLRLEKFYGLEDLSAISLLPESYRNALAVSIYLSAALQDKSIGRFIVFDDITSSFDAGHQYALMEVIRTKIAYPENPDGPQIIILSHDGLLEKYFDNLSNYTAWHHQKLLGLPPRGALLLQPQDANRLRSRANSFLGAGNIDDAEPLIRQYLEFKLLKIIRSVQIPVPIDFAIRSDRKMVSNSIEAIREAVDLKTACGQLILTADQARDLSTVHMPALMANWVAHYETMSTSSIAPMVLSGVLDSIDKYVSCFEYQCSCTGTPKPRFYKSLSEKACTC